MAPSESTHVFRDFAREAYTATVQALLLRDLDAARVAAAQREADAAGEELQYGGAGHRLLPAADPWADPARRAPTPHTFQDSWRDYTGWLCGDERTANWVAAWIERYLGYTGDAPVASKVQQVTTKDGVRWLAVRGAFKIGD